MSQAAASAAAAPPQAAPEAAPTQAHASDVRTGAEAVKEEDSAHERCPAIESSTQRSSLTAASSPRGSPQPIPA
eukprot:4812975-Amphidinium_carterae.1